MAEQRPVGDAYAELDTRLLDLAEHLDWHLATRIRRLVAADAIAHRVVDLEHRCQRAEDLAAECRRQLRSSHRQVEQLREELEAARRPAARAER